MENELPAVAGLSLTTWIALFGALLSTAVAAWTIHRDLLDRGKVELGAFVARVSGLRDDGRTARMRPSPEDRKRDPEQLVVTVTNVGRRPVSLVRLYAEKRDRDTKGKRKRALLLTENLPATLPESDFRTELVNPSILTPDYRDLYCVDSRERRWRFGRRRFKKLRKGGTAREW